MEKSFKGFYHLIGFMIVAFFVTNVINHKFQFYKATVVTKESVPVKVVEERLACLAINIYREAGYEPFEGKVAVAQVTLNRVEHPNFPKDVCAVVYQKNTFMEKIVCQFSWYCDSTHKAKPINRAAYEESYEVAKKVMLEGFRLDSIKDALYYHADYVNPQWKLKKVAKIGRHIFYTERNI